MRNKLSRIQAAALRRISGEWISQHEVPHAGERTTKSLRDRGLIEYRMNGTLGWHLTEAGREVLTELRSVDSRPKSHDPLCFDKVGHPHDNECECWCHDEDEMGTAPYPDRGPNYRECPHCTTTAAMSQAALDEHIRQAHPGTGSSARGITASKPPVVDRG